MEKFKNESGSLAQIPQLPEANRDGNFYIFFKVVLSNFLLKITFLEFYFTIRCVGGFSRPALLMSMLRIVSAAMPTLEDIRTKIDIFMECLT